jgi:prolyl oligopeptidase
MNRLALALAAFLLTTSAARSQEGPPDPFQWLEEIDAPRSLAWVEGQNLKSAKRLEGDARYETFRAEARAIFTAEDRIPTPRFRAGGVDNFWQDAGYVHGVWRHTSLTSYRTANPQWETILDLDALSVALESAGGASRAPEPRVLVVADATGARAAELRAAGIVAASHSDPESARAHARAWGYTHVVEGDALMVLATGARVAYSVDTLKKREGA